MNIYISNLDANVTTEQLIGLFKPHGEVKTAEVVRDVFTGLPRGFAYVDMPDDANAQLAISELNNFQLNDRTISVQEAKPKVEHKGSYPVGNSAQKSMPFQRSYSNQKGKGFRKRH
jgi:RNA recognition motif-containing protein